jgi:hydrogenase maturation protease
VTHEPGGEEGDVVVVGTGNPFRRDDGVGVAVLDRLRAVAPDGVRLAERDGEPTGIVGAWEGARLAVVVDAVVPGGAPGTVHRIEIRDGVGEIPDRAYRGSSHALGVGDAVRLARALGRLPARLVVLGIEAEDLADGQGLSAGVAAAVEPAARQVLAEIAAAD